MIPYKAPTEDILGSDIPISIWSPEGLPEDMPAGMLVVHDGSSYAASGYWEAPDLLGKVGSLIKRDMIPPVRVALLDPVHPDRNNWYTASPEYNRAMAESVLPSIERRVPVARPRVAVASSLGGLSMVSFVHQYREHQTFDGMLLQSPSWHHPDYDNYANLPLNRHHYHRGMSFIEEFRGAPSAPHPMDISITCGWEGNWEGDWALDKTLQGQGHRSELVRVNGRHGWEQWCNALTPYLGDLINRCVENPAEVQAA